jgi:hypothetical protein
VSHTGHSLGGSLDIFASVESKTPAIVFDPYGVKKTTKLKNIQYNPMVTAFFSGMNVINATSAHHGLCFQMQSSSMESTLIELAKDVLLEFIRPYLPQAAKPSLFVTKLIDDSIGLHSIEGIRQAFGTDNYLPASCRRVLKWPESVNDYLEVNRLHQYQQTPLPINQAADLDTLTDPNLKRQLEENYYQTESVGLITHLSADCFPPEFIEALKSGASSGFHERVMQSCVVEDRSGKDFVILTGADGGARHNIVNLLHVKFYAERVLGAKNQKNNDYDFECLITEKEIDRLVAPYTGPVPRPVPVPVPRPVPAPPITLSSILQTLLKNRAGPAAVLSAAAYVIYGKKIDLPRLQELINRIFGRRGNGGGGSGSNHADDASPSNSDLSIFQRPTNLTTPGVFVAAIASVLYASRTQIARAIRGPGLASE